MKSLVTLLSVLALVACTSLVRENLDERYGQADPSRYDRPHPGGTLLFRRDIQPILNDRCVVCHACYDAPCQLKLGSWEGLVRGASRIEVYNGTRLKEIEPTRLFVDAGKASQWRNKGFFPVLSEHPEPAAALHASVLARAIELKAAHPPAPGTLLDRSVDVSLGRKQSCNAAEEYGEIERNQPDWGMPFGLPPLAGSEADTLRQIVDAAVVETGGNT